MSRPGPLQEWPLESFLSTNYSHAPTTPTKSVKAQKRPLSPAIGVSQYSPAKRRILNEEGIISPKKSMKSPLSTFGMDLGTPSRFGHILAGPESPARVLDFGPPKNALSTPRKSSSESTQRVPGTSASLAPSPELKSNTSRRGSQAPQSPSRDHSTNSSSLSPGPPHASIEPLKIPRAPPACSVMGSIHYPGFQVYQDPFEYVYPAGSSSEPTELDQDPFWHKENLPPRRKVKKAVSSPEPPHSTSDLTPKATMKRDKAFTLPPEWGSGEAVSQLLSPKRQTLPSAIFPSGRGDIATGRRLEFGGAMEERR